MQNNKKIIVTFPRMGIYTKLFEFLFKELGIDYITPPPITKKTIELGTENLDELMCYPAKTTYGNLVEGLEKGANTIVMFSSEGICRFKNYYVMHKYTLEQKGYNNFRMCVIRPYTFLKDIKNIDPKNLSYIKILKALISSYKFLKKIEQEYESLNKKESDIKILVTGEIYCVNEDKVNMDILQKLRDMNVHIKCGSGLRHFLQKALGLAHYKEKKEVKKFLPHKTWAGHGFDTLNDILTCIKEGYDGAFHIYPFPCQPQSTITKYLDIISEKYDFPIANIQCDEFSGEAGFDTRIEAFVDSIRFKKQGIDFGSTKNKGFWLGIDIGSVSTKAAIIDQNNKVIKSSYILISGNPIEGVKKCFKDLNIKNNDKFKISGVGVTGSARYLISKIVGADIVINEITAQTVGSLSYNKDVQTIIEIGGLDSKCILIKDKVPIWHNTNSKCSSGSGSFLMREAERVNIPIEKFGDYALKSKMDISIACKCTVFAGQDCIHKSQHGFKQEDIINGLHKGMVRNFMNNTARNRIFKQPIIFNGGVAANKGVVEAFNRHLDTKIIVPEHHKVIGAIGAAILSKKNNDNNTKFKGFDVKDIKFDTKNFTCGDCPNNCEIVEIYQDNTLLHRSEGLCQRYKM